MNNLVFVTGLHGNERLPILALASRGIPQVVGNPQAVQKNVRFIDMDMNKAFGLAGNTVEEQAAQRVLGEIPQDARVIDFHSMSVASPPFAIVTSLNQVPFAQTLELPYIVYMAYNIKRGHALIDHRHGVSVEVSQHDDPRGFDRTLQTVQAAQQGLRDKDIPVFEVYGVIEQPGTYENFHQTASGKEAFYPILAGENSYGIPGLKARVLQSQEYGTIPLEQEQA